MPYYYGNKVTVFSKKLPKNAIPFFIYSMYIKTVLEEKTVVFRKNIIKLRSRSKIKEPTKWQLRRKKNIRITVKL